MLRTKVKEEKELFLLFFLVVFSIAMLQLALSWPAGPTITYKGNSTIGSGSTTGVASSLRGDSTTTAGGYIYTVQISSPKQNDNWKAYVGNVTGTLTLDDGDGYSIYEWAEYTGTITGEVYATRKSTTVSWSNINCSWYCASKGTSCTNTDRSLRNVSERENANLLLTSSDDNITTTFRQGNHSQFDVGELTIGADTCYAVHTFVNDTAQNPDASKIYFEEVLLYDGTNLTNGNLVYAALIDNDQLGYHNLSTYDFQMLIPENGSDSFAGITTYYFYVEI